MTSKPPSEPTVPGLVIMSAEGDGDSGWHLLPVWGSGRGNDDFLRLGFRSAPMLYSAYDDRGIRDANTFLAEGGCHYFGKNVTGDGHSVVIGIPAVPELTLAVQVLALVVAAQPTVEKPLTVTVRLEEYGLASYPAFRNATGWKETVHRPGNITLECEFVWDPIGKKPLKGSVPLVEMDSGGGVIVRAPVAEEAGLAREKLARTVQGLIKQRIHDGTLLAEKRMPPTMLPESRLPREIVEAGYYAALATYSNGVALPEAPQEDPVKLSDHLLNQYHRAGWSIGLGVGEAIAIEVRNQSGKTDPEKAGR